MLLFRTRCKVCHKSFDDELCSSRRPSGVRFHQGHPYRLAGHLKPFAIWLAYSFRQVTDQGGTSDLSFQGRSLPVDIFPPQRGMGIHGMAYLIQG